MNWNWELKLILSTLVVMIPAFRRACLKEDFKNLSALDISRAAIEQSKNKMGNDSTKVIWIVSFKPSEKFEFWHDRAVFHFLSERADIQKHVEVAEKNISQTGFWLLVLFQTRAPICVAG